MADAVPEDILKRVNRVLYTPNALCLCTFPSLLSRKTGKDIGYAMAEIKDNYTAIKTQGELHNRDNVLIALDNIMTGNEAIALVNLAIGNNGRLSERANPVAICCLADSRENKKAVYAGAQVFSVIQRSPKIYLAEYCKMCEKKVPLNHFL
jgi:hypothetical protein